MIAGERHNHTTSMVDRTNSARQRVVARDESAKRLSTGDRRGKRKGKMKRKRDGTQGNTREMKRCYQLLGSL